MFVIGIDAGISTTKVAGIRDGQIINPIRMPSTEPVASLYSALDRYMHDNGLSAADIDSIMLTGVGASYVDGDIYGILTGKVDEFTADCLGARHGCDAENMVVASMGTGTTLLKYEAGKVSHLGGIAMGGGTLAGLSRLLFHTDDISHVIDLAARGNINNVNVNIGDISKEEIPGLPTYATASLLGKAQSDSRLEDVALGVIWTVVQTIGSATILASQHTGISDFCMIGSLSQLPQCREIFDMMQQLYGVRFHIPEYAAFATAIGAAIAPTVHSPFIQ